MSTNRHQASTSVFEGLAQVAFLALQDNFPNVRIDLDEIDSLVDALETLDPSSARPLFARGTIDVIRKNWQEAVDKFRTLASQSKCLPHSKAMLTYALSRLDDPEWRLEAEQLRESTEPGVSLLARSLIAHDNPGSNRDATRPTGTHTEQEEPGRRGSAVATDGTPAAKVDASTPAWAKYALRA